MVHDLNRSWNTAMTLDLSVPDSLYIAAP
jgi:hypothetical protein